MRSWLLMLFAAISLGVSAQTITAKGNERHNRRTDHRRASSREKGNTTNGTITDLDGNYSITSSFKSNPYNFLYRNENSDTKRTKSN